MMQMGCCGTHTELATQAYFAGSLAHYDFISLLQRGLFPFVLYLRGSMEETPEERHDRFIQEM